MPEFLWIEGEEMFTRWQGPWQDLASVAGNTTPFQTFEWQSTWFKHFGFAKTPVALAAMEGTDLVGWWPMVRTAGMWPVLRPMGKGPSDYLHPLIREPDGNVVAEMAGMLLRSQSALIDLHQLRADFVPGLDNALKAAAPHPIAQAKCLVLDLPDSYSTYVTGLSKSLRYDVRRLEKPPFSTGEASVSVASGSGVASALEDLFALHAMRWRKRWQPGAFSPRLRRFHLEWAMLAERRGWLELLTVVWNGEPIGALYAMFTRGTTYYYQAGMDPSKNSISPGTLLVATAIRRAIERGDGRFDFLRGDESYKRRWNPQQALTNSRYLLGDAGPRAGMGRRWNRLGSRIEEKVRLRLEAR